jgi:hypothetical protein
MSQAHTTIAEAWQAYADDVLPIDTPEADVTRARRAYMAGALDAVQRIKAGATVEAVLADLIGYGRTVGRRIETARG